MRVGGVKGKIALTNHIIIIPFKDETKSDWNFTFFYYKHYLGFKTKYL